MKHGGDHLSALADGELGPEPAGAIEAHVTGCDRCARELEEVHEARRAVRSLPRVQPPAGWFENLIAAGPPVPRPVPLARRRYGLGRAAASVAAAAALVVLSTTALSRPPVDMAVDGAVEDHASTVSALAAAGIGQSSSSGDDLVSNTSITPTTNAPLTVERMAAPFRAPDELAGGYALTEGFHHPDGVQLVYERSPFSLSVFESEGDVDFDRLEGGRRLELGGRRAWLLETGNAAGRVVVVQLDGLAVALVGDEGEGAVERAAESLPGPRPLSMLQRLRRSAGGAIRTLSLG